MSTAIRMPQKATSRVSRKGTQVRLAIKVGSKELAIHLTPEMAMVIACKLQLEIAHIRKEQEVKRCLKS